MCAGNLAGFEPRPILATDRLSQNQIIPGMNLRRADSQISPINNSMKIKSAQKALKPSVNC